MEGFEEKDIAATAVSELSECFRKVGVDCPEALIAKWSLANMIEDKEIARFSDLLSEIRKEMDKHRVLMLANMSRIPQISRKTFDNFVTDRLSKDNEKMIKHLRSLDFIALGENIVIAGDPGTGKTHIAQAIGNLCCEKLIPVRYFKFSELIAKLGKEVGRGSTEKTLQTLAAIPCLIIDEMGFCSKLDARTSDLFFQLMDRRYDKGKRSTIFTSNKKPAEWNEMLSDEMIARCTLDRIMDRCIAIDLKGSSFRGQNRTVYKIDCSPSPTIKGLTSDFNK